MNEEELSKVIDAMAGARVVISQLRKKIKDLEFELKDLQVEMIKKNTYIEGLNAQIDQLKKKLPPDRGADE